MFTGLIQAIGTVISTDVRDGGLSVTIQAPLELASALSDGDSVAVNGVCLTATATQPEQFSAFISEETIRCTTLAQLSPAAAVNLERCVTPTTCLGGHLVSGHVDAIAQIQSLKPVGEAIHLTLKLPSTLYRYTAPKGSITVDGVSLTINQSSEERVEIMLIPHTLAVTTLGQRQVGDQVNIEVDLIARYCERLVTIHTKAPELC